MQLEVLEHVQMQFECQTARADFSGSKLKTQERLTF